MSATGGSVASSPPTCAEGLDVVVVESSQGDRQPRVDIIGGATTPTCWPAPGRGRDRAGRGHQQRHHEPVGVAEARQLNPAVRDRPPEPAGERPTVRRDRARRAAGAGRRGGARGVSPAVHAAAVAVPAGVSRQTDACRRP
ncbi:hypothetical protein HBB16_17680 [Pseudonocardia sp. MCCB 268]|nr:hypothetical protein [Pseudonocardia cytotoxica]